MKRGANVSLGTADVGASSGKSADSSDEKPPEPKKVRSLVEDEDDTPSTADGVALDLPAEPETTTALTGIDAPAPVKEEKKEDEPNRTPLAQLLARGTGAIVVLKGHHTVITDGHRAAINQTGNPAMATAGAGDVLTGVIASLIGQRMSPLDAAVLGVHVHGLAGDLARDAICGAGAKSGGITAKDIAKYLPRAVARCVG